MSTMTEIFGEPVYVYSRRQALDDGCQVDVSETAREAGIKFPVYLTRGVWDAYVKVPDGVSCQDEKGRLWDVVWMLRCAISRNAGVGRLKYQLYVRNDNRRAKPVSLVAECGPVDHDQPEPAITVMLPDED